MAKILRFSCSNLNERTSCYMSRIANSYLVKTSSSLLVDGAMIQFSGTNLYIQVRNLFKPLL